MSQKASQKLVFDYPDITLFPVAVSGVTSFFKKSDPTVDLRYALNCGYALEGMGLSAVPSTYTASAAPVNIEGACKMLDDLAQKHKNTGKMAVDAIPWNVILPMVMQLVQQLLAQWLNPQPKPAT